MRNELTQERAVRQDLECDKSSLERQVRSSTTITDHTNHHRPVQERPVQTSTNLRKIKTRAVTPKTGPDTFVQFKL